MCTMQIALLPGRKGTDNAITIQELVHSISKARGREGFMAIKINLEKAYNKLEWSFIREHLFHISLPPNLIDIIIRAYLRCLLLFYLMEVP